MDYLTFLREAIRETHGCEATHVETVPVTERFQGQMVWNGEVEVFHVRGHPTAKKLFAWAYPVSDDSPEMKAVMVLAVHPINTPQKAVQAFVVSQYKKEQGDNAS